MTAANRAKSSRRAQGLDEHVSDRTVLGLVADLVLNGSSPGHHNRGCQDLPSASNTTTTTAGHHSGHRHPRGGGRGG